MVPYTDVVFAFDMNRLFTEGGNTFLYDYGPSGFHFQFGAGAAAPTPQLDGSLSFDGGDYLSLPAGRLAEFYQRMPTRECTFLALTTRNAVTGGAPRLFSCETATHGLSFALHSTADPGRSWIVSGTGAGVRVYQTDASVILGGASFAATHETTPRYLVNQRIVGGAWVVGAYGTTIYDVASIPRIGMQPSAASAMIGRISFLSCIRGALSSPDLALYSRLIAEGVRPWCVR